jgi:hypothetical protein
MNILKWIGGILGAILLFVGKVPIAAYYERGVQYATDGFRMLIGFLVFLPLVAFFMNYFFMTNLFVVGQITLALVLPIIGVICILMPKTSIPIVAILTGVRAGQPGDQPNVPMIIDAFKSILRALGVVITWTGVYIYLTIVLPLYIWPGVFWIMHIPLVVLAGAVMAGQLKVTDTAYKIIERSCVTILIILTLATVIFQENITNATRMAHTKQKYAQLQLEGKERKDAYISNKLDGIYINPQGQAVKIENGKAVDASKELEAVEQALHEESIVGRVGSMFHGAGKEDSAHAGKPPSRGFGKQWNRYIQLKETDLLLFWGITIIGLLLLYLILTSLFRAARKAGGVGVPVGATPIKKNPFPIIGVDMSGVFWFLVLAGLAYGAYVFLWKPVEASDLGKEVVAAYGTSGTPVTKAYSIQDADKWGVVIIHPNQQLQLGAWKQYAGVDKYNKTHWKDIPEESEKQPLRITGGVTAGDAEIPGEFDITVNDFALLRGSCANNAQRTQTCHGSWESKQLKPYGVGNGTFTLIWEDDRQAVAELVAEDGTHIGGIKFRRYYAKG